MFLATALVLFWCWTQLCTVQPYASSTFPSTRSPSSPSSWGRLWTDWRSSRWRGRFWDNSFSRKLVYCNFFNLFLWFSYWIYVSWKKVVQMDGNFYFIFFSNQISELSLPLCLAELKVLDISKNQVKTISDNFLTECLKLETFIASVNKISKFSPLYSLKKYLFVIVHQNILTWLNSETTFLFGWQKLTVPT